MRGQHQGAVGQRLAAGQRDDGVDGVLGAGRGPQVRAARHPRQPIGVGAQPIRSAFGEPWPRGGRRGRGAWPRAARRSRRGGPARRRPASPRCRPAAMIRPPTSETFLKKCSCCWARWAGSSILPEPVAGERSSGPARPPARRPTSRGARPVASAAAAAICTPALIRTSVAGSVGIGAGPAFLASGTSLSVSCFALAA